MSIPSGSTKNPVLSPVPNEFSDAQQIDQNGNQVDLYALAPFDASGNLSLGTAVVTKGHASQVTGRQEGAFVTTPSGQKVRLKGIVGLDSSGNLIPFAAPSAASAASVSGKFQSAERTATGSAESIPHGLGVTPSLVLCAVQDTNGVALPHTIVEGTHTSTNIVLTVTANLKYKVIAFV